MAQFSRAALLTYTGVAATGGVGLGILVQSRIQKANNSQVVALQNRLEALRVEIDAEKERSQSYEELLRSLNTQQTSGHKPKRDGKHDFPSLPQYVPQVKDMLLKKSGHVTMYDTRNRTASWVCEHLTRSNYQSSNRGNPADRQRSSFREDVSIPELFRARLEDYRGSGFDRGHLAPAADFKFSQQAMNDSFLLSNISPQVGEGFNRDYWARLEHFIRNLTFKYDDVYVCTGPLYLPSLEEDGKWYVKYEVIGDPPNVAVPTHFFKILLAENKTQAKEMKKKKSKKDKKKQVSNHKANDAYLAAFIVPNAPIPEDTPLEAFHVPKEEVEKNSGFLFFQHLNSKRILPKDLCQEGMCQLPLPNWWNKDDNRSAEANLERELLNFVNDQASHSHAFSSTLSAQDRKKMHQLAESFNLLHKSIGQGTNRCLVVEKKRER